MRKYIMCLLVIIFIAAIILVNNFDDSSSSNKVTKKSNTLTMMLETDVNSSEYTVASSNKWPEDGYKFNRELSYCELGSKINYNEETNSISLTASVSDTCFIYFDKEPDAIYLADYIINSVYVEDGINDLYYHDGLGNYENASEEAGDYSYRYSGSNPANYVCFGSYDIICPEENLYRIIGIFNNQVKLIKNDYANSDLLGINGTFDSNNLYAWSNQDRNYWDLSELNTVNLNTNYLNNIGSEWNNLIAYSLWNTTNGVIFHGTVKELYDLEINNAEYYLGKVGLIYISDYGYSALPTTWDSDMYKFGYTKENNWISIESNEWTIIGGGLSSTNVESINNTFNRNYYIEFLAPDPSTGHSEAVSIEGRGSWLTNINYSLAVRPTFYLKSNVAITSGDGSQNSPFRVALG